MVDRRSSTGSCRQRCSELDDLVPGPVGVGTQSSSVLFLKASSSFCTTQCCGAARRISPVDGQRRRCRRGGRCRRCRRCRRRRRCSRCRRCRRRGWVVEEVVTASCLDLECCCCANKGDLLRLPCQPCGTKLPQCGIGTRRERNGDWMKKGACWSPRPEDTCCLKELQGRPRGIADPRAAKVGCAVGSPKECREERRGRKDPVATGKRYEDATVEVE